MSDEDYPYSIKNWKTAKEYPSLTKMNGVALAWEFLRRNPDYQEDFDDFSKVAPGIKYNHVRRKIMDKWFSNPPIKRFVPNPLDDKPRGLALFFDKYPRCYHTNTHKPATKYPNDKVVVFNLKIPLERQLEAAEKFLKKELKESKIKPRKKSPVRDALLRYLRVLDAKAEGKNNNSTIGKFLYKIEEATSYAERIRLDYDRAKEYRDETYIFLIDLP
jgi:hypothetical protein